MAKHAAGNLLADVKARTPRPTILVPYVDGGIREETVAAVCASDHGYVFELLDPADPGHYGKVLDEYWSRDGDLLVIEQDMVPTSAQINEVFACEQLWCQIRYHAGDGNYVAGLGFAKFTHDLKVAWPAAAMLATRDGDGVAYRAHWRKLWENLGTQLVRKGVHPHIHDGHVVHLHYPEASGG